MNAAQDTRCLRSEETFSGRDGIRIFMRRWQPMASPRAVVVLCHGVNSHSGQYLWTGERLAQAGFTVYAFDLRGRGRSEGPRFYIDDVSDYTSDLDAVVKLAKTRGGTLPIFLVGHSAGGVVSCTYVLERQNELAGFICESFAFRVPAPRLVLSLIKWLSGFAPNLPVLKLRNRDFTRDPAALSALEADPFTQGEVQPARTVAALVRANERLEREFPRISLPVLIMHGTADRATVPSGSRFFYEHVGSKDKTLKLYDGHFHDLLNDVDKDAAIEDVIAWISARLG